MKQPNPTGPDPGGPMEMAPRPGGPGLARAAGFVLGALFCAAPWCQPWLALAIGIAFALLGWTAFDALARKASLILIQGCIVLLGLRLDLPTLRNAAMSGILFAAATIIGTVALGMVAGRLLRTGREITILISSGTAVCGGSAIAAVGASIAAAPTSMAVATGSVFFLNAVALYLFPLIGHALHLSDIQFGTWAGVAIHDMSSVVNAAKAYHEGAGPAGLALDTANVVKLSRVLWIAPIALLAGWHSRRADRKNAGPDASPGARQPILPMFLVLFLAASALRTFVPELSRIADPIRTVAGGGFQAALFLIGAGLSKEVVASVGWRALALAVVLWVFISVAALLVVRATVG